MRNMHRQSCSTEVYASVYYMTSIQAAKSPSSQYNVCGLQHYLFPPDECTCHCNPNGLHKVSQHMNHCPSKIDISIILIAVPMAVATVTVSIMAVAVVVAMVMRAVVMAMIMPAHPMVVVATQDQQVEDVDSYASQG